MSYHKDIIEEIQDEMKINEDVNIERWSSIYNCMIQIKKCIDGLTDRIDLLEETQDERLHKEDLEMIGGV